jgi:hypothetical protein
MTLPTLLLAFLIALLYGALYHLIRGGGFWWLVWYLTLSLIGFFVGHWIGTWLGWVFLPLGTLNLGMCSTGSMLILLFGDWLTRLGLAR